MSPATAAMAAVAAAAAERTNLRAHALKSGNALRFAGKQICKKRAAVMNSRKVQRIEERNHQPTTQGKCSPAAWLQQKMRIRSVIRATKTGKQESVRIG